MDTTQRALGVKTDILQINEVYMRCIKTMISQATSQSSWIIESCKKWGRANRLMMGRLSYMLGGKDHIDVEHCVEYIMSSISGLGSFDLR